MHANLEKTKSPISGRRKYCNVAVAHIKENKNFELNNGCLTDCFTNLYKQRLDKKIVEVKTLEEYYGRVGLVSTNSIATPAPPSTSSWMLCNCAPMNKVMIVGLASDWDYFSDGLGIGQSGGREEAGHRRRESSCTWASERGGACDEP